MTLETVIGLEVHIQLDTRTKLFCGCPNAFGAPPNTLVCPVCCALPGALPTPNRRAVELAVLAGLALGCEIPEESVFERKHYFYPDLPKGYQITQFAHPLARVGSVRVGGRRIRIHRIQLEEDAGKLVHEGFPGSDRRSGVDLNRAGVPLIEIVSEPDLRSPSEAGDYARILRSRIAACGVSDADMEQGNLRMDGNLSVRRKGDPELGVKVELKNLNSFRFLRRALEHEEERQRGLVTRGEPVVQETRRYDESSGTTVPMRTKETSEDYRYFPDPDLPPLRLPPGLVEAARAALPEFPDARSERFERDHGLAPDRAEQLAAHPDLADYFEAALPCAGSAPALAAWITTEVLAREKKDGRLAVPPERLGALVRLRLPHGAAREVFRRMAETGREAAELVAELDFADPSRIREAAAKFVAAHPDEAGAYRAGNERVIGFLMGKLMRELGGGADAQVARKALERALRE